MKVKDLIKLLSERNPEHEVVLSKDSEGNNYSPLADYSVGHYTPESTWSGEFSTEEEEGSPNAICLWPTN